MCKHKIKLSCILYRYADWLESPTTESMTTEAMTTEIMTSSTTVDWSTTMPSTVATSTLVDMIKMNATLEKVFTETNTRKISIYTL